MYDSVSRRNIQWGWINKKIKERSDILPFTYTTSGISIMVDGEKYVVTDKNAYMKKLQDLHMKYGDDATIAHSYFINFSKLFDAVEDTYRKNLRITRKSKHTSKIKGR